MQTKPLAALVLAISEQELWTIWPRVCPEAQRAPAKERWGSVCLVPKANITQGHPVPTLSLDTCKRLAKLPGPE